MKILFLQPVLRGYQLSPNAGGKDKAAELITHAAIESDHEVAILPVPWGEARNPEQILAPFRMSFNRPSNPASILPTGFITLNPTHYLRHLSKRNFLQSPLTALRMCISDGIFDVSKAVVRCLRDFAPDLVVNNQTGLPVPRWARASVYKCPILLVNHSATASPYADAYDKIVWVSRWHQSAGLATYPNAASKSVHIPYFVSETYLKPARPTLSRDIVFIGLLDNHRKGLDLLMEALSRTKEKCFLKVIGTGSLVEEYRHRAAQLGLNAEFLGRLSDDENVAVLDRGGLFVMPSRAESFGIVYAEALCRGTPVIGFKQTVLELQENFGEEVGAPFDANVESADTLGGLIDDRLSWSLANITRRIEIAEKAQQFYQPSRFKHAYVQLFNQMCL